MQVSASRVYVLASTYPPSSVRADGGGRIHYQQPILPTAYGAAAI